MCEFCNRIEAQIAELKTKLLTKPCRISRERMRQREYYEANLDRKRAAMRERYHRLKQQQGATK